MISSFVMITEYKSIKIFFPGGVFNIYPTRNEIKKVIFFLSLNFSNLQKPNYFLIRLNEKLIS